VNELIVGHPQKEAPVDANKSCFKRAVGRPQPESDGSDHRVRSMIERNGASTKANDQPSTGVRKLRPALDSWFQLVEDVLGNRGRSSVAS
jgi:hypothetical protein